MAKPNESAGIPVNRSVKFVKKANSWWYSENYNKENTLDKIEFFHTEQEALERYNKGVNTKWIKLKAY